MFAEHNWHVYRNHERMVRFGDYLYIRNNFPNQQNLCYESDTKYPAGDELWKAHAAVRPSLSSTGICQSMSAEELFMVSRILTNSRIWSRIGTSEVLEHARSFLSEWTEQTGDSIPDNPTPNRHDPPRIVDAKIIPAGKSKVKNPHAEMPGASRNASGINHSGPVKI